MSPADASRPDPTRRFSDRVEAYIRFRPHYPAAIFQLMIDEMGLTTQSCIAEIGSGTGIFAEMLLKAGYRVIGVEPNTEMRVAAERLLGEYSAFLSVAGSAESTRLPDASVDMVAAAQAFHWFQPDQAAREFRRILRAGGAAALIWNERLMNTPFLRAYEQLLLEYGTDYHEVGARHAKPEMIDRLFAPAGCRKRSFPNAQVFDFDSLQGRLLSASYAPAPGHPRCAAMLAALRRIFDEHQEGGEVRFGYETEVYFGPLE